jgi:hypothetical protein
MTYATLLRLFLLIITNAGGEGKTFVTMLLRAIFDLLGEDDLSLDTDPGNKALSSTGGGAKYLDPFAEPEDSIRRVQDKLGSKTSLLIDAGANMQATSRQFEEMCRDLGNELRDQEYTVSGLWVISTNKLGSAGSSARAAKRIDPPFSPAFVFNDRDGSGAVPDGIKPDIKVEHLQPGLIALVNDGGGFASVVKEGIPGHQHSANLIADYLWRFADQPGIRVLFGNDRIDSLMPTLKRDMLNLKPYDLKRPTNDAAMEILAKRAKLLRFMDPYLDDVDELIQALQQFKAG